MIVDLNDKAFKDAKQDDIFIVEEKNGKKFASPISKQALFEKQFKQLETCQKECIAFRKIVEEQKKEIQDFKDFINQKLKTIGKIVGGYDNE